MQDNSDLANIRFKDSNQSGSISVTNASDLVGCCRIRYDFIYHKIAANNFESGICSTTDYAQNDDTSDIHRRCIAVLSLVNNRNLGNVVEGWGAEEVAGAMRPQAGELPEKSAHRVFELLTPAMINEISRGNSGNQNAASVSNKTNKNNALEYQWADMFAVSKRKASVVVDRQVRLSTVDVKELKNRQNARSNLDQQRFEMFLKTIDTTRSQTYGFFASVSGHRLKWDTHTPWSCDHRIRSLLSLRQCRRAFIF